MHQDVQFCRLRCLTAMSFSCEGLLLASPDPGHGSFLFPPQWWPGTDCLISLGTFQLHYPSSVPSLCPPGVGVSPEFLQTLLGCLGYKVSSMRTSGLHVALGDLFCFFQSSGNVVHETSSCILTAAFFFLLKSVWCQIESDRQLFEARGDQDSLTQHHKLRSPV